MFIILFIILILVFVIFNNNLLGSSTESFNLSDYSLPNDYERGQCLNNLYSCKYDKIQRLIALRRQVKYYKKKILELERLYKDPSCKYYKNKVGSYQDALDKQIKIANYYYSKFRELQEKFANIQRNYSYLSDEKERLRQNLIYCKRYKNMNPTVIKQYGEYSLEHNSTSSLGINS